ncbi:hypothetical protein F170042I7_21140 [Blautia caecimuris]|mgnify:FL=1|uniref:hypothetical protein n=1 Tax=Blautia caecimuris TaxID=1796615 RepID=UPI0034B5FF54
MEEIKTKLIESLLKTITYDDMTLEQERLVVEYETEKLKPKVDDLKRTMSKEQLEETIHEWWLDHQIADETENNLIAYIQ